MWSRQSQWMYLRGLNVSALFLFSLLYAGLTSSQGLPDSVNPAQIERDLETAIELAVPPPLAVPPSPTLLRPSNVAEISFELKDLEVVGATSIGKDEIEPLYADLVGTTVSLDQIYDLAEKLTALYRSKGFVLSQALLPAQKIEEGVVTIQVVEGFVDRAEVEGIGADTSSSIVTLSETFVEQKPLLLSSFERGILLINDLPGINTSALIGKSVDGELGSARVKLPINQDPWSGSASINNRGGSRLGPARVSLSGTSNLIGVNHTQLGGSATFALGNGELGVVSGYVNTGLSDGFSRVRISGSAVIASPEIEFDDFNDLETDSTSLGVSLSSALIRSRLRNLYLKVGFNAFNTQTLGQQVGDEFGTDTETSTREISFGLSGDIVDGGVNINQLEVTLVAGLDGLGATDSRVQGESPELGYRKIEVSASRLQSLSNGFSLLGAIQGQISSDDDLPSSETFSIGGQSFVRAYDNSEVSGSDGVAAKVELRYNRSLQGIRLNPYGYYDIGVVDNTVGEDHLSAVGVGVRFSRRALGGYGELSFPLDGDVSAEGSDDPRLFGGVSYSF